MAQNKLAGRSKYLGNRFGRLIVLESFRRLTTNSVRVHIFKVECECGTIKQINARPVILGKTKSCGCWKRESDCILENTADDAAVTRTINNLRSGAKKRA